MSRVIEGPPLLPARADHEPPRRPSAGTGRVARLPIQRTVELTPPAPVDLSVDSVELLRIFEKTGRPDVFEAFMRRHASMVYATCLKVTRDPHDAEDATQATFLTLASKSRVIGEIRQPEAWLRKVAHRLALDLIRSKKRRVNRENVRSEMTSEAAPLDSHDHADHGEVKGILNEELQKLPASYRMPLILHYFGGLSREEMAAQLNLKPSTLGVRLHRAREQLRKRLANRGIALPAVAVTALLTEAVRHSICATMIPGTASQASAIALGQAAPPTFAMSAGGGTIFGSVRSILAVLAAGKLKYSIVALVLGTAISMTSAQVRSLIPDVIRALVPTFNAPSLPKIDLQSVIPTLTASNFPTAPKTVATNAVGAIARPMAVSNAAAAAVNLPYTNVFASRTFVPTGGLVASSSAAPRSTFNWSASVGATDRSLNSAVVAANSRVNDPTVVASRAKTLAAAHDRSPNAIATAQSTPKRSDPAATDRTFAPPAAFATSMSGVGTILPSSGFGPLPFPNLPSDTSDVGANDEMPSHAGANVTGPVPSLARTPDDSSSPSSSRNDPIVVASSGASSSGGGGSGGGGSASNSFVSSVRGGGTRSSASHASSNVGTTASQAANRPAIAQDVPQTAVFTGVASNYGGYADAAWVPTKATDATGVIQQVSTPISGAFDMAQPDTPVIPGENLSINGARVTVHGLAADAAQPTITFVDTTGAGVPAFPSPHVFFGVWELDHATPISAADILVRYDDLRAARLGLHEQNLKLWVSDGTTWELLWKDPTFGRDAMKNLLWVTANRDFKYFAVSSPEPATLGAVLGVVGVLAARRRRRA